MMLACHVGDCGFESRRYRQTVKDSVKIYKHPHGPVGVDVALSRRRSRVRVPLGVQKTGVDKSRAAIQRCNTKVTA